MLVSSSLRLTSVSARNVNIIRSCLGHVLEHYLVLSPKLYPCTLRGICLSLSRQCSARFVSFDGVDDHYEKDESKYFYKKLSRKQNAERLMECTGCDRTSALTLLKECPSLKYTSSIEISRKIKSLNEKGISSDNIVSNHILFTISSDLLEEKLAILAELGIRNLNLAAPLLGVPLSHLKRASTWSLEIVTSDKTRISILCDKLKCDPAEIALAASVHKFLLSVPFDRMVAALDILLGEGVTSTQILRDMWVLRYSTEQVESRIFQARNGGIKQFKTWMVRCTQKILNNTIRRQAEKRTLLGPHKDSTVNYISSRLNVSREEAQLVLERQPQLRGVGAAKLCNTFDFLLGKQGDEELTARFNQTQIWHSSRILCHSLETMKVRLARLRELGYEPKNPVILYKTKRKFEEFMKKLKEKQEADKLEEEKSLKKPITEMTRASQKDVSR